MTHEEIIEQLQDQVLHNRITQKELEQECDKFNIDMFDEVIHPLGYNLCDRCGDYGNSEQDFCWLDYFPFEDDNPNDQALLRGIGKEKYEYCAICWDCVKELQKKVNKESE